MANDEWATPQDVTDAVSRVLGPFDLDVAATARNATAPVFYTVEDDGLSQPWKGCVWCNPPYSETGRWTRKAAAEFTAGRAELVVMLVPARPGSQWWRDAVASGARITWWPVRISFGDGAGRAPFDSALLVWHPGRVTLHAAKCDNCGGVFLAGRRHAVTCSARCRTARSRAG